jgi:hypothetical protein
MLYKIKKILTIKPFEIVCEFNTHEIRKIDLTDWVKEFKELNNGWTSKLAEPQFFMTAKVADYGTIVWGDDIDFDPQVLYQMSKPVSEALIS